jgi:hypothetical protein
VSMVRRVAVTMVHLCLFILMSFKLRNSHGSVSGQQNTENWWVRALITITGKYAGEGSIIAQDDAEGGRSVGLLTAVV